MHYVSARNKQKKYDMSYRVYVTDALYFLGHLNIRFSDWVSSKNKQETRTPEEIVNHIRTGLRGLK